MTRYTRIALAAATGVAALMLSACSGSSADTGYSPVGQQAPANNAAAANNAAPGAAQGNVAQGNAAAGSAAAPGAGNAYPNASAPPAGGAAAQADGTGAAAAPAGGEAKLMVRKTKALGSIVVDGAGWTLYRYDKDTASPSKSNCEGACAEKWPPVLTQGTPQLQGVDPSLVGTVRRSDGSLQVTLAGWPLYRYVGDTKPGDWKGHQVGGVWWAVTPNGKKAPKCLPGMSRQTQQPAAGSASSGSTGGYDSGYSGGY